MNRRAAHLFSLLILLGLAGLAPAARASDEAISQAVPRPAELERDVQFWIRIYSEVSTSEGYLHDERDLGIVYRKLKFRPSVSPTERREVVDEQRERIQAMLRRLASGATDLSEEEQAIATAYGALGTPERYRQAADLVRFQLGQSDRFREGLLRSGAWEPHIEKTFASLGLPPELAALPHVESSFDPSAYSKVGAAGLWQFMRSTGRRYLRIDEAVDERMDPFRSTEAAAQLLDFNYRLLGSWPLALTAYNHGAAGMRRARDSSGTSDIAWLVRNYKSPSFGFASRNFYVSFLAALEIDRNPEKYFGDFERHPPMRFEEVAMPAYVPLSALESTLKVDRSRLASLNPALRPPVWEGRRLVPKGYRLRLPVQETKWTSETLAASLGPEVQYVGQPRARSVKVKKGQSLADIAASNRVDVNELARLNRTALDAGLKTGRTLMLPDLPPQRVDGVAVVTTAPVAPVAPVVAATPPPKPASPAAQGTYVVRAGDSLAEISSRVSVPQSALIALNNIRNPDSIYEGQRLRLSEAATGAAAPTAQTDAAMKDRMAESRAVAAANVQQPEPVTEAEAEEESPSLVPGGAVPQASDPVDYSVAANGSVRVAAAETLGHYAEWLGIPTATLRTLNGLGASRSVAMGRLVKLDFSRVEKELFEQRRRAYHQTVQAEFFAGHRIVGTEVYVARSGDSLWAVTQHYGRVPAWLLQQYNPDIDFAALRAGIELVIPKVEALPPV